MTKTNRNLRLYILSGRANNVVSECQTYGQTAETLRRWNRFVSLLRCAKADVLPERVKQIRGQ